MEGGKKDGGIIFVSGWIDGGREGGREGGRWYLYEIKDAQFTLRGVHAEHEVEGRVVSVYQPEVTHP